MRKITLKVYWSKKENDFVVDYQSKSTGGYVIGHVVGKRVEARRSLNDDSKHGLWESERHLYKDGEYNFHEHDFIKEMQSRGYDTKTLKFSIKIEPSKLEEMFPHVYETLTVEEKQKLGIT